MIREIAMTNFKCFSSAEVDLGKLNVFAGANGTGKSSVIQALLVLFQSIQSGHVKRDSLQVNGTFIELGTARDVLFKKSTEDRFEVFVADDAGKRTFIVSIPKTESEYTPPLAVDPPDTD